MVKVTAKGKFFNEDGIIRRLKEGKVLVRFYTYGTMFEEWMDPNDVRKLSNIEILKGLSGPTKPVTQRDFDGPSDDRRPGDRNMSDPRSAGPGPRNRRQDRTERSFRQDAFQSDEERGQNERNWNWYQNNQQDQRRRNDYGDRSYGYQAGSNNNNNQRRDRGGDWAIGNVDSQWGRNSPQNNNRERQPRQKNRRQIDLADAALRGDDDWSAFVTPAAGGIRSGSDKSNAGGDDDDFFASLMNDLSSDLGSSGASAPKYSSQSAGSSDDDDFFASLMSEISDDDAPKQPKNWPKEKQTPKPSTSSSNDEDFFAALEAELGSAFEGESTPKMDDSDDLFAKLEAELSPQNDAMSQKTSQKTEPHSKKASSASDNASDIFFAELEAELSPSGNGGGGAQVDSADDFFAELEADLAPLSEDPKEASSDFSLDVLLDMNEKEERKEKTPATKTEKPAPKQGASSAEPHSVNPGDLQKQTIPALKDMLRERGLKVSGKKSELIERLLQES